MNSSTSFIVTTIAAIFATGATGGVRIYVLPDETAQLRPSTVAGYDLASGTCAACHSLDYITMQPPGRGRAFWQGEVSKMINSYRASIDPDDARAIVEYLADTY